MSGEDDPVEGRLDDALDRLRDLEIRAQRGEDIPNATIVTEVRAIRDDLLAERRATQKAEKKVHDRIDYLDAKKVDKNPTANRVFWIFMTAFAGAIGTIAAGLYLASRVSQ